MDFLDALGMGFNNSYGQLRDDLSSILGGGYNPGTLGRVGEVAGGIPLENLRGVGPQVQQKLIEAGNDPRMQTLLEHLQATAPKLMQAAQQLPQTISTRLQQALPGVLGNFKPTYNYGAPSANTGAVNVATTANGATRGFEDLASTLAHELTHAVSEYGAPLRSAKHSGETAAQLAALMSPQQQQSMKRYTSMTDIDPFTALQEAYSYGTQNILNNNNPLLEQIFNALGRGVR